MSSDRKPVGLIRVDRPVGIAGTSHLWEVQWLGRVRLADRDMLKEGLASGAYSGIENVRREDGDWGPLFGRPLYREVFDTGGEPRDHAKARERARIARHRRRARALAGMALGFLVIGFPAWAPPLWVGILQLAALGTGMGAGYQRLRATMQQRALDQLADRLLPPVTAPPPLDPDWARLAAEEEVEHLTGGPSP